MEALRVALAAERGHRRQTRRLAAADRQRTDRSRGTGRPEMGDQGRQIPPRQSRLGALGVFGGLGRMEGGRFRSAVGRRCRSSGQGSRIYGKERGYRHVLC